MIHLCRVFASVMRKYVRACLKAVRELGAVISSVRKLGRCFVGNAVLSSKGRSTNIVGAGCVGAWAASSKGR